MKICPACRNVYPQHFAVCPREASALSDGEVRESTAPPEDPHPGLLFFKAPVSLKKTCPQCHAVYPDNLYACTHDGAGLLWLVQWTAGDLIKAKAVCSMMKEGDPLRVPRREYRLLASLDENDSCLVFKALELDSGRERTLVTSNMDLTLVPRDAGMAEGFKVFAQALFEWTTHPNENLLEIAGLGQIDDGRLFFVLDLEEGRRLAEVIRQEAPLPPWPQSADKGRFVPADLGRSVGAARRHAGWELVESTGMF
jgi:hypothetical protein